MLKLWNNQINHIKINLSYEFSALLTRQHTEFHLSCTTDTVITPIVSLGIPKHLLTVESVAEHLNTITGEIIGTRLIREMRCTRCGYPQVDFNVQYACHRCEGCKFNQCVESFTAKVSGTIVMITPSGSVTLTVPPSSIITYLTSCKLLHLLRFPEDLQEHFLGNSYFDVVYNAYHLLCRIQKTSVLPKCVSALTE